MMNKQELVNMLATKGYTKKDASCIIDDVVAVLTEALAAGEEVKLHGFGQFYVAECKARKSIDYQTKEPIEIPAYKYPKFSAGNTLRRAVKEGVYRE